MILLSLLRRDCRSVRPRLLEGIEGRLSAAERSDVTEHLGRCGACADEIADLAAARHAVRRAFAPYRRAEARIAPARARLRARSAWSTSGLVAALVHVSRGPARHGIAFAVVALLFVGAGSGGGTHDVAPLDLAPAREQRVSDLDDPRRLIGFRYLPSQRIPVSDSLVIEFASAREERPAERPDETLPR